MNNKRGTLCKLSTLYIILQIWGGKSENTFQSFNMETGL